MGPRGRLQPSLAALLALGLVVSSPLAGAAPPAAAPDIPVEVHTERAGDEIHTRVEGSIAQPFQTVAHVLAQPRQWCQFVPIDPTVRGCVWREAVATGGQQAVVTLFGGRENELLPDSSFELPYAFEVREHGDKALEVRLRGDEGPMGARDYRMRLRAVTAGDGETRLEVSTRLVMSSALQSLANAYLQTLGRDKFGFSVVGHDTAGRPHYVRGIQGLIERAAMRHYLALQAYLDSLDAPAERRFEASIRRWWQLSQRHPQLEEESRELYLDEQRREHESQLRSQSS